MRTNGAIQLYPMLRIAIFFILGIVIANALEGILPTCVWLLTAIIVLILAVFNHRRAILQTILIFLAIMTTGGLLTAMKYDQLDCPLPQKTVKYEAVVISQPEIRENIVRCDLRIIGPAMDGLKVKATFLRDSSHDYPKTLQVGDGITARSRLKKPQNFIPKSHFNYMAWLLAHGFSAQTIVSGKNWQQEKVDYSKISRLERVKIAALRLRKKMVDKLNRASVNATGRAIVAAVILGDRSHISQETSIRFAATGASHILALSGLHLGILFAFIYLFLGRFRNRWYTQLLMFFTIWSYVFLVGMSTSVMRAAIMFSIYALVNLLRREPLSANTLALAAVAMLVANPLSLFDVSFQMSFLSMGSIVVFYRPIFHCMPSKWIHLSKPFKWLWSLVSVSVAAQLGVAPIILYYFGSFSCIFILTNLVAVPLITAIIYLAVIWMLLLWQPFVSDLLVGILTTFAHWINTILGIMERWKFSNIGDIDVSAMQVVLIYMLIACTSILARYLIRMFRSHHGAKEEFDPFIIKN